MPSEYLLTSSQVADPTQAIRTIEGPVRDTITWATNWGYQAGFLILGIALFYQFVIMIVRPDK